MHSKYKIIAIVLSLLLVLSLGTSIINYKISLNSTQKQLVTQSLPLSIDNIYTEIQKQIIEPYLVSSMMANDTFVHDWLVEEENSVTKIQRYLESIKNRYGMLSAFLVSDKTQNYYTENGFLEKVKRENETNKWYFTFKNSSHKTEINIDLNEHMSDNPIMFINFKMFDDNYHYLGVTGVAIEVSYLQGMFIKFKEKYHLNVNFLNNKGEFILLGDSHKSTLNIKEIPELRSFLKQLLSKETHVIEYEKDGSHYIINTKYIKELDLHLTVEAKLEDFTHETKKSFYLNVGFSLLLASIIAMILINIIKNYNKKLETISEFDELTNIPNRRSFHNKFEYLSHLENRSDRQMGLLYIDLDNFKMINDEFGHSVGDTVLKEFAKILEMNVRKSDIYARWGGEEFIVAFTNISLDIAKDLAEKLRISVEDSVQLKQILKRPITISIGLTLLKSTDTLDTILMRADEAMYNAKTSGKNKICIL